MVIVSSVGCWLALWTKKIPVFSVLAFKNHEILNQMHMFIFNLQDSILFSIFIFGLNQRPDQYKMKILVFSTQYDFQILKCQYQYSIWGILNKYQYQYAQKTEVSVFSISILSGKKCEKQANQANVKNGGELKFLLNRQ